MLVAIDRASKFAFAELHERATMRVAADFLRRLIDPVPDRIHTVLTKPNHPWTNGQAERMNRPLQEAAARRYHYETHDHLRAHLRTLKGLTVFELISSTWTSEPHRFKLQPDHLIPGSNS